MSFRSNGLISKNDVKNDACLVQQEETINNCPNNQGKLLINEVEKIETKYDKYTAKVNGENIPLYVDTQRSELKDEWIKLEKFKDGYLLKINFNNKFINDNYNTQTSKAAFSAIAIVLVTSMLQAQDLGLKLSDSAKLLDMINKIMGDNNG